MFDLRKRLLPEENRRGLFLLTGNLWNCAWSFCRDESRGSLRYRNRRIFTALETWNLLGTGIF